MPSHSPASSPPEIARGYLQSFAGGDPEVIAAYVSDDFENIHTATLASNSYGRTEYLERLPDFLSDMVDLNYEVEQLVTEDSTVAAFYVLTAKWQGKVPIRVRGIVRILIENGLIIHRTDYWDSQVFLQQVAAWEAANGSGE